MVQLICKLIISDGRGNYFRYARCARHCEAKPCCNQITELHSLPRFAHNDGYRQFNKALSMRSYNLTMTKIATQTNFPPTVQPKPAPKVYKLLVEKIVVSYSREDALMHILFIFLALAALTIYCINLLVLHYTILPLPTALIFLPVFFILWWALNYSQWQHWSRFSLFTCTLSTLIIYFSISLIIFAAIITTPFPTIDRHLVQWDHALGFNVTTLMTWAHQHPFLLQILRYSYNTWLYQILLTPLLLALLNRPKEISWYFTAGAMCYVFWMFIYYFFPTIAPAGVMHNPYFTLPQYDLVRRFYEVHLSLPISSYGGGGMIAFPSGHVMFSLLVLIALRKVKVIFYPLLAINSLLIFFDTGFRIPLFGGCNCQLCDSDICFFLDKIHL